MWNLFQILVTDVHILDNKKKIIGSMSLYCTLARFLNCSSRLHWMINDSWFPQQGWEKYCVAGCSQRIHTLSETKGFSRIKVQSKIHKGSYRVLAQDTIVLVYWSCEHIAALENPSTVFSCERKLRWSRFSPKRSQSTKTLNVPEKFLEQIFGARSTRFRSHTYTLRKL